MTDVTYSPGPRVDPSNARAWQLTYEKSLRDGMTREEARVKADDDWDSGEVVPRRPREPAAQRLALVMMIAPLSVPPAAIDALNAWEKAAEREASQEEISAILGKLGIDPLLSRAQRTVPGSGLPAEVPPVDPDAPAAPKRRGRPPGSKNSGSPTTPISPPNGSTAPRAPRAAAPAAELHAKEHRAYLKAAKEISALLVAFPPWRRRVVLSIAGGILESEDSARRALNIISGETLEHPHGPRMKEWPRGEELAKIADALETAHSDVLAALEEVTRR